MKSDIKDNTLKGTTTIGIVCKDGIVLAADKKVSAGYRIAHKYFDKIYKVADNMAVTIAGLVSDAQLLTKLIKAEIQIKKMRTNKELKVKEAANLLAGIVYNNVRIPSMIPGIVGFLIGGKDDTGFHLFELSIDGSVSKHEDYTSDGSGSDLAIGVLETLYRKNMSIQEGIDIAVKALNAAIQRDMPTGSGIDVFTITDKGVEKVLTKHIDMKLSL